MQERAFGRPGRCHPRCSGPREFLSDDCIEKSGGPRLRQDESQLLKVTPEEASIAGEKRIRMNLGMGSNQEIGEDSLVVVHAP